MIFKFFEKGRNVILAWLVYLAFGVFLFQFSLYPKVKEMSGNTDLPEERFGFSADYFYKFLAKIDEAGRSMYFSFQLLDFINAMLLGFVLSVTIYYFLSRITDRKFVRVFLTFPIFAAVFDILENSSILYLLQQFPERSESLVAMASLLTRLKLTAGSLSGLVVLVCGVILLLKFIVGKVRS